MAALRRSSLTRRSTSLSKRSTSLSKKEVERLLEAADGPADTPAAEVATLRDALTPVLTALTGCDRQASWTELMHAAAALAGWPVARRDALVGPNPNLSSLEDWRDALWDLVTELNERRTL